MAGNLKAPLQMPTLRIELDGVKQAMVVALTQSTDELLEAVKAQLTACLERLTPEEIIASVHRAFDEAVHEAVRRLGPELVEQAVTDYFTTGQGAQIVREAIKEKFKL